MASSSSLFQPAALFITFREAVEAGVIVSVALAFLKKTGLEQLRGQVFWGAGLGVAASVIIGIAILTAFYQFKTAFFSGPKQTIFEGSVQLAALLRMMSMYGKWKERLEGKALTLSGGDRYALFLMAFTATFREGVEAVVFITGTSQGNPTAIPIPGFIGLFLGCSFSYLVFFGAQPINIAPFMYCTAFFMFAIGAGLLSRAFSAFQRAGYFGSLGNTLGPDYSDYTYSSLEYMPAVVVEKPDWLGVAIGHFRRCCADSNTSFFAVLRAIFGYSDRPTRLAIIAYCVYWAYVLLSLGLKWKAGTLFGKHASGSTKERAPSGPEGGPEGGDEEMAHLAAAEMAGGGAASLCEDGHAHSAECSCNEGGALRHRTLSETLSRDETPHDEAQGLDCFATEAHRLGGTGLLQRLRSVPLQRLRSVPRRSWMLCALLVGCTIFALSLGLLLPRPSPPRPVMSFTLVIARSSNASLSLAPAKPQMTINGQWPGPTMRVPLGSSVVVTIVNELTQGEATAVHWHGMLQRGTPWQDGVVGVTQCPIPSVAGANSLSVEFTPDRAGTFWYHGHMGGQIVDGLYGALIVDDGGASFAAAGSPTFLADDWVWLISDWYNTPVCWPACASSGNSSLLGWYMSAASAGLEPIPDAIVVNDRLTGTMSLIASRSAPQLVRLVNAAAINMYNVSVDGMPLTVVELDGVAIAPLVLPWLVLNVAQRASVVLDWDRMHPSMASMTAVHVRISAMAMYSDLGPYGAAANTTSSTLAGAPVPFNTAWIGTLAFVEGASPGYEEGAVPALAAAPPAEANLLSARPFPAQEAPNATQILAFIFGFANDPTTGVNLGYVNNVSYALSPAALVVPLLRSFTASQPLSVPTRLTGVLLGDGMSPFLLPSNRVVQVLISNRDTGEHPFHLHGHNFWIVATSAFPEAERLFAPNYVRRDVVSVPPGGWAKIRFVADNPGVWLLHCHIEWHMHAGLAATLVEGPSKLYAAAAGGGDLAMPQAHADNCRAYASVATIEGAGSGYVAPSVNVLMGGDAS